MNGELTPPPGAGFVATTEKLPAVRNDDAPSVAVMCALSVNVELTAVPLNEMVVAETKPVPTMATGFDPSPTVAVEGVTVVMTTFGFVTVNEIAFEVPPPGDALTTVMLCVPDTARSEAGSSVVIESEVDAVTASDVASKSTDGIGANDDPEMVTDVSAAPANAEDGVSVVSTGVGLRTSKPITWLVPPPGAGVFTEILSVVATDS